MPRNKPKTIKRAQRIRRKKEQDACRSIHRGKTAYVTSADARQAKVNNPTYCNSCQGWY